jgi:hypothetical protein
VDATGLIEDGSVRAEWGTVVGRVLDPHPFRDSAGHPPLENGAPDRISAATDAAARALGWVDPESARSARSKCRAAPLPRGAWPFACHHRQRTTGRTWSSAQRSTPATSGTTIPGQRRAGAGHNRTSDDPC